MIDKMVKLRNRLVHNVSVNRLNLNERKYLIDSYKFVLQHLEVEFAINSPEVYSYFPALKENGMM